MPKKGLSEKNKSISIDRGHKIAYNKIMKKEKDKKWGWKLALQIALILISVLYIGWIFSNSLKDAPSSTEQSQAATSRLQAVFAFLAPNSFIANAEGADLERLHSAFRTLAHFLEFALLGALLLFSYLSFTQKRKWAFIPLCGAITVGIIDECLQLTAVGRAFEWLDLLIDGGGAAFGWAAAGFAVWLVYIIVRARKKEKENE